MAKNLLIGVDFGTDSVRAILHTDTGTEVASCVQAYARWAEGRYCNAIYGQFRQHPLDYTEALEFVLKGVLAGQDAKAVRGIGIDTTGATPCAVDRNGTPLALQADFADDPDAMFILWKDHTAIEEAERINHVAAGYEPDYRRYSGGIYSSEWFWSKILHVLKNNARVRKAAFSWVEHCDWIVGELCGHTDPLTMKRSRCAAGHKAMWNAEWGGLPPEEFLVAVDPLLKGLRQRLYTETYTADKPAGTLCAKWAERLGLSTDVVIANSGFDCHFGGVGAQIKPGEMVMVMGTSTCNLMVSPAAKHCVRGICGQVDGSVVPGLTGYEAGQSAFGDVYAWFRRLLEWAGPVALEKLEQEAAQVPPGAHGVTALDWFNGRRTPDADATLTGVIAGLNLGTTAPMIYRALIESTAFGARAIIERFIEEGVPVTSIAALGGISRKSPLVMQICADVLQRPIKVVACEQACALGGAMFAAVAAGIYPDTSAAMAAMGHGYDAEYTPNPQLAGVYDDCYKRYCQLGSR